MMAGDAEELVAEVPPGVLKIGMPYAGVPHTDRSWDELVAAQAPLSDYQAPPDDALAMLIYTSGTSGAPKGVMLSQGNLKFAISHILEHTLEPLPRERLFSYLPLAHLMERIFGEALGLAVGAETHFLEKPEELAQTIVRVAPTRFSGVPLVYSRIQAGILSRLPQKKLDRLLSIPLLNSYFRRAIRRKMGLQNVDTLGSGAAPMPVPQIEWFARLGLPIHQGYGMTENCAYAAVELPGAARLGSVGRPLPGSGFRLSEDGEIQFKHDGVMAGYFKDPEQTRAAFTTDGWLRTGDKGRVDADGYLYITGRIKDLFKTGKGKYVAPAHIEGALLRNTDLDQVCLVGAGLNQPIMLVTLNANGKSRPREELARVLAADMEAVNAGLEEHEAIAKCVVLEENWTPDNGLITPTAKVRRAEVEARYAAVVAREAARRESYVVWA
jgi:long-chain acyl-CoA synthetase